MTNSLERMLRQARKDGGEVVEERSSPKAPPAPEAPSSPVEAAPRSARKDKEKRENFSTRLRASQKAALAKFVLQLKLEGHPVSQEDVLEHLLARLTTEDGRRAVWRELTSEDMPG